MMCSSSLDDMMSWRSVWFSLEDKHRNDVLVLDKRRDRRVL